MPKSKPDRKAMLALAYKKAVENGWHVGEAASWATEHYGSRINKGDIQYYAMKNGKPYLDEVKNGIRMVIQ